MSGGELAEACRRAADDDFIVEEDVTRLRTLLRDAAATLERWEPIVQAEPTSIECAWCSEPIYDGGMGLHSGCTLTCPKCGERTVLDTWKPDGRARFYSIVARASEPLGGPNWKCRMCLWVIGVEGHAPDCPLQGDAA